MRIKKKKTKTNKRIGFYTIQPENVEAELDEIKFIAGNKAVSVSE